MSEFNRRDALLAALTACGAAAEVLLARFRDAGDTALERNFEPGFRTELQQKDLEIALQTARELGISLPATANAQQIFNGGSAADAKADHSAVVKVIERLADHDLTK